MNPESTQRQTVTENGLFSSSSNRNIAENIMWGGYGQEQIAARYGLHSGKRADSSANASSRNPHVFSPMKVKVNVPGLSLHQLQWGIQEAGFERTAGVQKVVLEEIQRKCPGGRWWIKTDDFDVKEELLESVKQKWSGNTDVELEKLQNLYKEYLLRREKSQIDELGVGKGTLEKDLSEMIIELKNNLQFLQAGEKRQRNL